MKDVYDLKGRTAIVTGGTRGLGRAIAVGFARAGVTVVATARKPPDEPFEQVDGPGAVLFEQVDVSDAAAVPELLQRTAERLGGLDIVVANAGISDSGLVGAMDPDAWGRTVATNLNGTFYLINAAVPLLRRHSRGHGRIITLSSCMARTPAQGTAAYTTTKAAIEALTHSVALQVAADRITANCIAPGILTVGLGEQVATNPKLWRRYGSHLASGRRGRAEDVASLAVYLASDAADYINGATIPIDGGITTWV